MAVENIEERLAAMNNAWATAPTDPSSEWPPDGDYQAIVRRFDFFEGKRNSHVYLKTELEISLDREYDGRIVETVHNMTDPDRLGWLKKHLATLGCDVESIGLDEIRPGSQALNALLDVPVAIVVRTSDKRDSEGNPYRNVYVNERLGGPLRESDVTPDVPEPAAAPAAAAAADDDIPW